MSLFVPTRLLDGEHEGHEAKIGGHEEDSL